jgi:CheY-like chemotaxis protein
MQHKKIPDFIVIDDDPMNNIICSKIIEITIPGATTITFTSPEKGLEYILETFTVNNANDAILFLDINMPYLNGWQVLDRFQTFPKATKDKVNIFMLSSSVDTKDKELSDNNLLVSGFITKSLSQDKLREVFSEYMN